MTRTASSATAIALIAALIAMVVVQAWALPAEVARVVATFPEVRVLAAPAIVWGIVAILCWQLVAAVALRLVRRGQQSGSGPSVRSSLRFIAGCMAAYVVLVIAASAALIAMNYATPGVMLGLFVTGIVALALGFYLGTRYAFWR